MSHLLPLLPSWSIGFVAGAGSENWGVVPGWLFGGSSLTEGREESSQELLRQMADWQQRFWRGGPADPYLRYYWA